MKTIKYITAIMMVLIIWPATIQAQSTQRTVSQHNRESVNASRKPNQESARKEAVRPRTVQPAQQSQVERKPQVQPTRQAQQSQVERKPQVQHQQVARQQVARTERTPVSITTSNNPRSTYRSPDSRVYVTPNRSASTTANKYSSKRYYGGNHYHYAYPTRSVDIHYHYDTYLNHYHVLYYPTYTHIYWNRDMYRDYRRWYPQYQWRYNYGYRIQTISIFDAQYNLGEVAMVYGRVYATWYNNETDDFLLFFGGDYPTQQFTVVLPGNIARKFSWRPERYFLGEHITVTGLITTFDGIPEIVVKNKHQIGIY